MRTALKRLLVVLIVGLNVGVLSSQVRPAPRRVVSDAEYERWKKDLSNWGRWGKDDQIGALNLITPSKRKQAAGLVKEGISVSLAADVDTVKAVDNPNPFELTMLTIGTDRIAVSYHGIAHTHLDSMAHINFNGVFYNGYAPDPETVLKQGHARNSIHNLKNGIFTRGILIDIPRLKGVPYLEPGTPIYADDLEAWEKKDGREGVGWRCLVRANWRLGPPEGRGAMAPRQSGRREVGRTRSIGHSMAQSARYCHPGKRSSAVRGALQSARRRSRLRVGVPGCAHSRQLRPRGARGCGCSEESVGVPVDCSALADSRRDRIAAESDRDVLDVGSRRR